VRFVGLWLEASMAVLEERVKARRGDASDATLAVLHAAARSGAGAGQWVAIDAGGGETGLAAARAAVSRTRAPRGA